MCLILDFAMNIYLIDPQSCLASTHADDTTASSRYNVLMIAVDDMRPLFGECYNEPEVLTPNMDKHFLQGYDLSPHASKYILARSYHSLTDIGASKAPCMISFYSIECVVFTCINSGL